MKITTRFKKRLLCTLIILFLCMNVIAFFHARKFTRFTPGLTTKTNGNARFSFTDKLKILLTGIDNPRPITVTHPAAACQTIYLQSNKRLECWLLQADSTKGTVLLCHGYAGDKSSMLDKAAILLQAGYNTLLVDFMGSGGSEGNQTTIGYKEAEEVKTCIDYLQHQGEKHIFLFGTSMGAVAIMKALQDYHPAVAGAIIECPFGTLLTTVQNRFRRLHIPVFPMASLLVFWGGVENGFNGFHHKPVNYARHITCPVLLIYGEKDDRVTCRETEEIFANLAGPKKLVTFPLAGHDNYLKKYAPEWTAEVVKYLNTYR